MMVSKQFGGGDSKISNDGSQLLLENVIGKSNRENYDKIVERAKEREMMLMDKMLKNEEMKNVKYEEQDQQRAYFDAKIKDRQKRQIAELKRIQEEKYKTELRMTEYQKKEEIRSRQEAFALLQEKMEAQERERQRDSEIKKKREEMKAQKEIRRKEKAEKAAELRNFQLERIQRKSQELSKKAKERDEIIRRRTIRLKRAASERREQFAKIKERVSLNLTLENQRKWNSFMDSQREREKREEKNRQMKQMKLSEIKEKVLIFAYTI